MKSFEGQGHFNIAQHEGAAMTKDETLLTPQSLQAMNYFKLLAYAQDNDPQLLAIIREIKLENLKRLDADYFFREYNGEIDANGYLLDKSGSPTSWLPTQIDQTPDIHALVAQQIKNEVMRQRPELASSPEVKKSPDVVNSPELAKARLENVITTESMKQTLRSEADLEKLARMPVFNANFADNLTLDKLVPDTNNEYVERTSTEVRQLEFVSTDAVIGRPMGRVWGEEYDDRKGRTQAIVDNLNASATTSEQSEQIFNLENKTSQRIKLRALETPSGDVFSVQDGTHRVSGIKAAELSQFPAEVTRNTYPGKITTTDSALVKRCERLFELGLASGSITEGVDEKGVNKQTIIITDEKYSWLRNTSSNELGQILKTITKVYPDVREAFAVEGIPKEAFDDPLALDHFLTDEETYKRYLSIIKEKDLDQTAAATKAAPGVLLQNEALGIENNIDYQIDQLIEQPHAQAYLKTLQTELGKETADTEVVKSVLYNFLTRRSSLVEQQNERGETDLVWMKEKFQPQSDWYQKAITAVTNSLEQSGITVNESNGWFGATASERQPNVVPEGKFKVYESIAPGDYAAFMQSLPSLIIQLRTLGTQMGEKISIKTPSTFLSFITHNDSIVVHCDKKQLQPEIQMIIRAWQQKNGISKAARELGRTHFAQDSEKNSFTDKVASHVTTWLKEHQGNFSEEVLAKEALKYAITFSRG